MGAAGQKLFSALTELTGDELTQLHARAGYLLKAKALGKAPAPGPVITEARDGSLIYGMVLQELPGKHYPPYGVFKKGKFFKAFDSNVESLSNYVRQYWGDVDRARRLKLYRIFVRLVVDNLEGRDIPATPGSVGNNLGRVSALVDCAFPGYRASGLLDVIVDI